MGALTVAEGKTLTQCESVIKQNLKAFYEVGIALMTIRDNGLYREHHGTFEEYCKGRWGFTKSRANQLISASEVADNLTTTVVKEIPERQLRPLTKIKDPAIQREVYQRAVETAPNGKVTAKHMEKVVKETMKKPPPEPPRRLTRKEAYKDIEPISKYRGTEWSDAFDEMLKAIVNARGEDYKTTSRQVMFDDLQTLKEAVG